MSLKKSEIEEVVKKMRAFERSIDLRADSGEEAETAMTFLRYDYPSTFHVGDIAYTWDAQSKTVRLKPTYLCSEIEYKELIARILTKIGEYKKELLLLKTDEEKERYVHDLLCKSVVYADDGPQSHSIVGPLLEGRGVCDGISKTAQELFHIAGLRSHVIAGEAKNAKSGVWDRHAWNIVQISGNWRHIDVTFDRTISEEDLRYDYFNLPTSDIQSDHRVDPVFLPFAAHCTATDDWFVLNGVSFTDRTEAEKYIVDRLKNRKETICFRLAGKPDEAATAQITDCFTKSIKRFYSSYSSCFSHNEARNVFYWKISYGGKMGRLLSAIFGKWIKEH